MFKRSEAVGSEVRVPCGQCVGCRLERSRQWAVRCVHEASMHDHSCFVTLTYSPEHVPSDGSLNKKHCQDFFKRLRKRLPGQKVRYFLCGEYGERLSRPHYHACIFGYDFPDRVRLTRAGSEFPLYKSAFLDSVWRLGFCSIGELSFESASYVARYVVKKVTGRGAEDHYWRLDEDTGELSQVSPEYVVMSRRPGIGAGWFEKYGAEVFPADEVISRGHPAKPPRFYDKLHEARDSDAFARVKRERIERAAARYLDNSEDVFVLDGDGRLKSKRGRLSVKELCAEARLKLLKRGFEDEI